ncbi:MAG: glycosyl hydrolase 53 family protein [Bacteroidetes bacterium]|nr:glycosyl hydrolase 53 family protein [Bacteroidota bacterium]
MKSVHFVFGVILCVFGGCKKTSGSPSVGSNTDSLKNASAFIKGADISWLTQMEAANIKFYDSIGNQKDCMQIMKGLGMNAIRLRAWVNPSNGWCNTHDLRLKAIRANNLGFKIMIDFHYSDVWADPAHQSIPIAWNSFGIDSLQTAVYNYTLELMDTLKANGIIPVWAQVGNETNDGMLWEDGRASTNMQNFALLINAGYNAIKKSSSDSTKVIIHISNGYDNALFRWIFDGLSSNHAKWDIIGMSLYPSTSNWQTLDAQCLTNMNDMVSRYHVPVMICEVGMDVTAATTCASFLMDIISKTKSVIGGNGLGVFYWEPECYNNWQGYSMGAFDNTGKPTIALNAFKN